MCTIEVHRVYSSILVNTAKSPPPNYHEGMFRVRAEQIDDITSGNNTEITYFPSEQSGLLQYEVVDGEAILSWMIAGVMAEPKWVEE